MRKAADVGDLKRQIARKFARDGKIKSVCVRRFDFVVETSVNREVAFGQNRWKTAARRRRKTLRFCGRGVGETRKTNTGSHGIGTFKADATTTLLAGYVGRKAKRTVLVKGSRNA